MTVISSRSDYGLRKCVQIGNKGAPDGALVAQDGLILLLGERADLKLVCINSRRKETVRKGVLRHG